MRRLFGTEVRLAQNRQVAQVADGLNAVRVDIREPDGMGRSECLGMRYLLRKQHGKIASSERGMPRFQCVVVGLVHVFSPCTAFQLGIAVERSGDQIRVVSERGFSRAEVPSAFGTMAIR